MVEMKKTIKRKKPKFLRNGWHKMIKLGSTVKKSRKWRTAKGRHNKIRLNRKGHSQRPKVGWGAESRGKGFIEGIEAVRVENLKALESLKKGVGIIIGSVSKRKKEAIIMRANEMKIKVLNKYKKIVLKSTILNVGDNK